MGWKHGTRLSLVTGDCVGMEGMEKPGGNGQGRFFLDVLRLWGLLIIFAMKMDFNTCS